MKITYNCEEQEFKHIKYLMHTTYTSEETGSKNLHQLFVLEKKLLRGKKTLKE